MTDPTNRGDDDLRRLLHDAVADVRPHGSLDDIRSRAEVVPMKRWFFPTLAVAAVMAAIVGGGFWLLADDDERLAPSGTSSTDVTGAPQHSESPSSGETQRAVPVYYVGDTPHGKRLFREFHRRQVEGDALIGPSVKEVLQGHPDDPDYSNPWADLDVSEFAVGQGDNVIEIELPEDLRDRPAGMSEADAELALQQLVFSAEAGLGHGRVPVQLQFDDKPADTVLGVPASEPLAADDPADVLALVQVDTPGDGTVVSQTFTVTGRANTFEANVAWELKKGDTVVKHGFTTAEECCTLAPYTFKVTAPPGTYTLVVHDTDESGGDRPVDQDTKEITVK